MALCNLFRLLSFTLNLKPTPHTLNLFLPSTLRLTPLTLLPIFAAHETGFGKNACGSIFVGLYRCFGPADIT